MSWYDGDYETIDLTEHFEAQIKVDQTPQDPRDDYDPMGRLLRFERGAIQEDRATEIIPAHRIGEVDLTHIIRWLRIFHGAEVALIRGYVHSGTALTTVPVGDRGVPKGSYDGQFTDRWDSMWWGLIFVTRDDLKREYIDYGSTPEESREKAQDYMRGEVETLEAWINGDVYGYTVVGKNGEHELLPTDATMLDSCWGFYGYDHEKSGLKESAMETAKEFEEDYAAYLAAEAEEAEAMRQEEAAMRVSELGFAAA